MKLGQLFNLLLTLVIKYLFIFFHFLHACHKPLVGLMWRKLHMLLPALCVVGERGNNFSCCRCLCRWKVDYRKGSIVDGARRHVLEGK